MPDTHDIIKLEFHDADTDTDTDILARISAKMSASESASWNAGLTRWRLPRNIYHEKVTRKLVKWNLDHTALRKRVSSAEMRTVELLALLMR